MARNVIAHVGLDIGTSSVKVVELLRSDTSYKLRRAAAQLLGENTPEALAQVLKPIAEAYSTAKHLRIGVSGSSLLIRRIEMPHMDSDELRNALKFEAENHIPFPVDECILDHHIVQMGGEGKSTALLLIALKKDFIQERIKMLHDLGFKPELVDVDAFGLVNAFEQLGPKERAENRGLLNIGHGTSLLTVMHGREPFFVREIAAGGLEITRALAETLSLDESTAERLKVTHEASKKDDLRASTLRALSPLINELKSSIEYFENESGEELGEIWVSGGGASSEGAEEILASEVGRSFKIWDPLERVEVLREAADAVDGVRPAFAVALGLAVRESVKLK